MDRPVHEVVDDVRSWRQQCGLSNKEIARLAGINHSTVYRILEGYSPRLRYGPALRSICKLANISTKKARSTSVPPEITEVVLQCWDGTEAHANRIAKAVAVLSDLLRPSKPQ